MQMSSLTQSQSQYYRRRPEPEHYRGPRDFPGSERYGRRHMPRNYSSMGGGGYGYGQNVGYGGMYSNDGLGYGPGQQGLGRGQGRGHSGGWRNGRVEGRTHGHHGYSSDVGRDERGYPRSGNHRDNYYSGGYREPHRGGMFRGVRGRVDDGGRARRTGGHGGRGGGRGRGGREGGERESVKYNCMVRVENLPLGMTVKELRTILQDLGFDRKMYISKVLEEGKHKTAIVQTVEEAQDCINRMDELKINGESIACKILDKETLPAPTKTNSVGFIVNLEFSKFNSIPTQTEIEEKIRHVGLDPKKWKTQGEGRFSMIIVGQGDQREEIKTDLSEIDFGEDTTVSVKDVKKRGMAVKVCQVDPVIQITNLPKDWDARRTKAALKKILQFEVCVEETKEGNAKVSYTPRLIDVAEKIEGMKIGDNVVKVVGKKEKKKETFSIPGDCSEERLREVLGVGSLVPAEIRADDAKLILVFKPTKENLPQILQRLAKMTLKEGEEKIVVVEEEEDLMKSSDDVKSGKKEVEDGPLMNDDKPVEDVVASNEIREQKNVDTIAEAQSEKVEGEVIDMKVIEEDQS